MDTQNIINVNIDSRAVTLPVNFNLGVMNDNSCKTITFMVQKKSDITDLTDLTFSINTISAKGKPDKIDCDCREEGGFYIITALLKGTIFEASGKAVFNLCGQKFDSSHIAIKSWGSEDITALVGSHSHADKAIEELYPSVLEELKQKIENPTDEQINTIATKLAEKGFYTKSEIDSMIDLELSSYQTKTDDALITTSKEVVGAINENASSISELKSDLGNVTTNKTGKNLFNLKDGKESFDTYFDVEFKNGLITVSKGTTDYNNYLKLNTKRTVTLEKGTYTFSVQNVSNDINLGFIRLLDKEKEVVSLSLYGSNLGVTSRTFKLSNYAELTLEIEVNCVNLTGEKSFNLQIEQGTKKTQYEVYTEEKLINADKINYEESSINKLKLDNLTINCDDYCIISIENEIVQIQKGNKSFQTGAYITKKIATINLNKGNYSISAQDTMPVEERQLVSISFKINDTEIENSQMIINIPSFMSRTVTLDEDATIDVYITLIGNDLNNYFTSKNLMSFKLMIEEGTFSSSWTKYEDDILFDKNIYLPRYVKNELYNLKWNAMGDSLTSAIGTAINYQNYISGKYSIVPRNYGIAGSTIASGTDSSNPMVERYANMNDDADIITIFGGTNDYGAQIKIGEDDSTDTSTFKGALNVIIDGLMRKYPGKRIGFITPMQRADIYKTVPLETYVNAMVKICANKSIPCLDLYHNGNLNPAIDIIANTFFRANVSSGSDKLHLNEKGHLVISRIIDDFLHRL